MSTAIWKVVYRSPGPNIGPILTLSSDQKIYSAQQHTICCNRDRKPVLRSTSTPIDGLSRRDAVEILSYHLRLINTWVGVFEDRNVLSETYMDRVALPFHTSQWSEIKPWTNGSTIDHPGVTKKHRLIAKCHGIKDTVQAMEQGIVPVRRLGDLPTWVWWTLVIMILLVGFTVTFL